MYQCYPKCVPPHSSTQTFLAWESHRGLRIHGPPRALSLVSLPLHCGFLKALSAPSLLVCPTWTTKPLLTQQTRTRQPPFPRTCTLRGTLGTLKRTGLPLEGPATSWCLAVWRDEIHIALAVQDRQQLGNYENILEGPILHTGQQSSPCLEACPAQFLSRHGGVHQ